MIINRHFKYIIHESVGPLGGGSHVSTAGGLLAVILRFDGECAAPLVDNDKNYVAT